MALRWMKKLRARVVGPRPVTAPPRDDAWLDAPGVRMLELRDPVIVGDSCARLRVYWRGTPDRAAELAAVAAAIVRSEA